MTGHPNAKASTATTVAAAAAVYLARRYGYTLSSEWSIIGAGAVISGVLFVGRRGIKGTVQGLWHGTGTVWTGNEAKK